MTPTPFTVSVTARRYCPAREVTLWACNVLFEGCALGVVLRSTCGEPVLQVHDQAAAGLAEKWCRENPMRIEFKSSRPPVEVDDLESVVSILAGRALHE